jgi:hypothetical protein
MDNRWTFGWHLCKSTFTPNIGKPGHTITCHIILGSTVYISYNTESPILVDFWKFLKVLISTLAYTLLVQQNIWNHSLNSYIVKFTLLWSTMFLMLWTKSLCCQVDEKLSCPSLTAYRRGRILHDVTKILYGVMWSSCKWEQICATKILIFELLLYFQWQI